MSSLFRNSSPGALTREQAVALEKKRAAERRKAVELAKQGRGGDTEVAHLACGELVIPRQLQTPEFLEALGRVAAEHNVPLEMLSIGEPHQSKHGNAGVLV